MSLFPEWARLDLLGACVDLARRGEQIDERMKLQLSELQESVDVIREHTPWRSLTYAANLSPLDQDILACAVAPVAEPRLGWMYQELQSGIAAPYPTPALMQELYFMEHDEAQSLHAHVSKNSALARNKLIVPSSGDAFAPVRSTRRAHEALLGWAATEATPFGTLEITSDCQWQDLILPPRLIDALENLLLFVTHRETVVAKWGARGSGGPVALFTGPSGTGKTLSAQVFANVLGWPLYRVDLGMVVSKYIGETEENLNALFDAAHGKPMVLLFDEAESLFGRRGEIEQARDRFANMEVSHLLSRIERHTGPCILTTNLRDHLDPAFTRRFQSVIDFSRPNRQARAAIWKKHLPPHAPYESSVDVEFLATEVDLTGGQIRNAALFAAFLAAGDNCAIGLEHIARAVWAELAKQDLQVVGSSLGALASHVDLKDGHRAAS